MNVDLPMSDRLVTEAHSSEKTHWVGVRCQDRWSNGDLGSLVIFAPTREWAEKLAVVLNERETLYETWRKQP